MTAYKINIAQDFSRYPGTRYIKQGPNSGQKFREDLLEPEFLEALKNNGKVVIELDGTEGLGSSFLEEAFGGLVRKYGIDKVRKILELQSENEIVLTEIKEYIDNAN